LFTWPMKSMSSGRIRMGKRWESVDIDVSYKMQL
jgi:hypothetical protein